MANRFGSKSRPSTLAGQWFGYGWTSPPPPLDAPTSLSATPVNTSVDISFAAPANYGGSPITNYEYSFNNSTWTALSPADAVSPVTISGLSQNTAYTVYLRGVNPYGSGPGSDATSFTTQGVPTSAPTGLSSTQTNTTATISFTAAASSTALTNYEYSFNNSSWTALSPADAVSPVTITGLTQNTAYTVYLRGVNSYGSGPGSTVLSLTTQGVPTSAPTSLSSTQTNTTATISFTAAASSTAITNYEYSFNNSSWTALSPADAASPVTITGLTQTTAYTVYLRGVNSYGVGPGSTVLSLTTQGVPTSAPTSLSAIAANTSVAISFTAAASSSALTNYEYSFNNSTWTALSPADATSPVTVSGLTQNTAYTVYLRGVNSYGVGPGSTGRTFSTDGVPLGTPTITSVTVGNTTATVNFTYPGGGGAVTGYDLYVANQTNAWNNAGVSVSPISVTGLSAGTSYTFYVRAKNAYGTGPQSAGVSATTNQLTVQYFVLGGGGGGASASSWNSVAQGSGGGGGGITTSYGSTNGGGNAMSAALNGLAGTTQTVTVGGGGGGGAGNNGWAAGRGGSAGGSSQFASIVSTGGGGGRAEGSQLGAAAGSLGYQTNAANNYWAIGGSSAAGSAGTNATRPGTPYGGIHGAAGSGITTTITGGGVTRGGAGGNGATQNSNGGVNVATTAGGAGGGGSGGGYGNSFAAATAAGGAANYGAGGGSGSWYPYGGQGSGGAGGSGYVVIRYPNSYGTLASISGGLAWSTSVDGSDRVYQFTGGTGPIVFPSY